MATLAWRLRIALPGTLAAWLLLIGTPGEAGIKTQFALHRPATAQFFFDYDDGGPIVDRTFSFGDPNDVALLADFDGDTIADLAIYRKGVWFINLMNDSIVDKTVFLGDPSGPDIPVAGDFLGNGKAGIGVFRNGTWFLSTQSVVDLGVNVDKIFVFGAAGDLPVVADFDGDGKADCAVYRPSNGFWFVSYGCTGALSTSFALGGLPGDLPVAGDFAATDFGGDWRAGVGIYRNGTWFLSYNHNGVVDRILNFGTTGDRPLVGPLDPANSRFVRQGATGGNGSQVAPFGTIAQALASPPAGGVTIRIAAGTYPEAVNFSSLQNTTFLGAGVNATHLTGSPDAFVAVVSTNITLRNLHVASPNGRGIIAQGSSMTLDRVSMIGNWNYNVLGVSYLGTNASLLIQHSNIDQSQIGNGLRLEGGVSATVQDSTIDGNGTTLTPSSSSTSGRGVEIFNDSVLTMDTSSVSNNFFGGVLLSGAGSATISFSDISSNGHNGIAFDQNTSGNIFGNVIDNNGVRGTRGATTGFNGIELQQTWTGSQMLIHENYIFNSTTNGVFIGRGAVTVANNFFYNNFVQLTVDTGGTGSTANVTARGNTLQLPVSHQNEAGVFLNNGLTITLGGSSPDQNTYKDFVNNPVVICSGTPTPTTICPFGGNVFTNSSVHNVGCSCPP